MARLSWWVCSPYSDWRVARRGRQDGKAEPTIPPWKSTELPPFLREMKDLGNSSVLAISRTWARRNEDLEPRVRNALERERDAREKLSAAVEEHEDAREHYIQVHGRRPQEDRFTLLRWYKFVIGLLFVFEFPMNMFVFRLFGENELLTILVTFGLAFALLLSAHHLGKQLREGAVRSRKNIAITLAAIVFPIAALVAVAWLREQYLEGMGGIAAELSGRAMLIVFLTVNVLIYVIAALMSHEYHDEPSLRLHKAATARAAAERALAKAERAVAAAKIRHHETWQRFRNRALEIQDAVQRSSSIYWRENYSARPDRGKQKTDYPAAYGKVLELDIPANLQEYQEIALAPEGGQSDAE